MVQNSHFLEIYFFVKELRKINWVWKKLCFNKKVILVWQTLFWNTWDLVLELKNIRIEAGTTKKLLVEKTHLSNNCLFKVGTSALGHILQSRPLSCWTNARHVNVRRKEVNTAKPLKRVNKMSSQIFNYPKLLLHPFAIF